MQRHRLLQLLRLLQATRSRALMLSQTLALTSLLAEAATIVKRDLGVTMTSAESQGSVAVGIRVASEEMTRLHEEAHRRVWTMEEMLDVEMTAEAETIVVVETEDAKGEEEEKKGRLGARCLMLRVHSPTARRRATYLRLHLRLRRAIHQTSGSAVLHAATTLHSKADTAVEVADVMTVAMVLLEAAVLVAKMISCSRQQMVASAGTMKDLEEDSAIPRGGGAGDRMAR